MEKPNKQSCVEQGYLKRQAEWKLVGKWEMSLYLHQMCPRNILDWEL